MCLQILAKSLCGEEPAGEFVSVLFVTYSISTNQLLACMRDHSSVNNTDVRTLKIVYQVDAKIENFQSNYIQYLTLNMTSHDKILQSIK